MWQVHSQHPSEWKSITNFGEKRGLAYPETAQKFWVPLIISGTGKATDFKFLYPHSCGRSEQKPMKTRALLSPGNRAKPRKFRYVKSVRNFMWKRCYRKDDRAMHRIRGCPEKFWDSLTTPTATVPKIFHGLLFRSTLWIFLQNLKSVALPAPEITKKFGQSLDTPMLHFLLNF